MYHMVQLTDSGQQDVLFHSFSDVDPNAATKCQCISQRLSNRFPFCM